MKIIKQSWEFMEDYNYEDMLLFIERCGRVCYKSEDRITKGSAEKFLKEIIIPSKHHSVLEHKNISIKIITDRGVSHEWVRHRIAAYSQESTRYCNYSKDKFGNQLTFILPVWFYDEKPIDETVYLTPPSPEYVEWFVAMEYAEKSYLKLLEYGQTPQQARTVLPNSLKTELVATHNIREWRHIFSLRAFKGAHPQMIELASDILNTFKTNFPVFFEDI
jgi:thymidylate synthase (FAD)